MPSRSRTPGAFFVSRTSTRSCRCPIWSPSSATPSSGSCTGAWPRHSPTSARSRTSPASSSSSWSSTRGQDLRPPPKFTIEECKAKDMTYAAPIFVRAQFMNATTGEIKEQTVFMGDFPMMTARRARSSSTAPSGSSSVQLVRSPGVIFQPGRDAKTIVTGTVHPYRGEWIEFDVEAKPGKDMSAGYPGRPQAPAVALRAAARPRLRGRGVPGALRPPLRLPRPASGRKSATCIPTREDALLEIYKRARPGEPLSLESARAYFENAFFNSTPLRPHHGSAATSSTASSGPRSRRSPQLLDIELERPARTRGCSAPSEILAA